MKTPFDFVASALRATGADIRQPVPLERTMRELGMPLYFCQPPTGYKDTAEAWVNTGALINRMNFAVALAANTFRGVVVSDPLPDRNQSDAEIAVDVFLNGDASNATRATIQRATTAAQIVGAGARRARVSTQVVAGPQFSSAARHRWFHEESFCDAAGWRS